MSCDKDSAHAMSSDDIEFLLVRSHEMVQSLLSSKYHVTESLHASDKARKIALHIDSIADGVFEYQEYLKEEYARLTGKLWRHDKK